MGTDSAGPSLALLLAATMVSSSAASTPVGNVPDPTRQLSEYAYDSWDMDSGLPQNSVMALAEDPIGYLWLGTFNGLARYDGAEFHRFSHPDLPVLERGATDLLIDPDGTMWIGTQNAGVIRISPKGEADAFGTQAGLPSNIIWTLYRDRLDRLWVGTASGLCQWRESALDCLGPEDGIPARPISGVRMTADGSLWIGTEGAGLFRFKNGQTEPFQTVQGKSILRVQDLELGPDGHLWIATFGAGLVEFNGQDFHTWGAEDGLGTDLIRSLLMDESGSLWIGTYGFGLVRMVDGRFDRLDSGSGLPNGHVQSLMVDSEGSFWFGTNGGLNRLRVAKFSTISTREGLSGPFARAVTQTEDGRIWVGTDSNGLSAIDQGKVVESITQPQLLSDSIRALWPARDGGLWIGAYAGGLSKLASDGQISHPGEAYGLGGEHIRAILDDSHGNLWMGMDLSGLIALSDQGVRRFSKGSGLTSNDVRAIAEAPDGSIWIGTYGQGLFRFADDQLKPLEEPEKAIVFSIRFDPDGTAWLGTGNGLVLLDAKTGTARPIAIEGTSGAVFQVLDDGLGRLWLCTNVAVLAVDRSAIAAGVDAVPAQTFDSDHGMRSRQCNGASQPAGWQDDQGRLWFPTADGVSWVDPASLPQNPRSPPVVIQAVRIDGHLAVTDPDARVEVQPGARRLEIDFAALSFISPGKQNYRHRLIGLDPDWVSTGSRRSAFYNDVPPGTYTFQVVAANSDQVWNLTGDSLQLVVHPLLHQTLWFRVLAVATVLLIIGGLYRWRIADLKKRRSILEYKVTQRTQALAEANTDLEKTLEELNNTQAQLVEAEKMAALGVLVAGVAHEINTPVGVGLTVSTHLTKLCADSADSTLREGLVMIQRNLERAAGIISRFKRIAVNKEREARRHFQLVSVLSDTRLGINQDIASKGHQLIIDCPEDLELNGYPEALFELINHLTANAIEHAFEEDGGIISIRAHADQDEVVIFFGDDGVGIDSAIRQSLFEPFSTQHRGTHSGLGLHIVYNIATRLMGGEIRLLEGPGAQFEIRLPLSVSD
jgi:ligand-binding sensor domain-containing protein/signal transduction histidine kinase